MAEVFISYSQKDRALVAPIAAGLRELGVDVWYDSEISAGQSFGAVIRARLKEAKAVLVCWSPEAVASEWVDAEADYARELGTFVPAFIVRCALLPPFNRIHTDDLSKWTGARDDPAWLKLVDRLADLIGREAVAAAARALAASDEAAKYEFARRYPDEPLARKIWASEETRLRAEFADRLAEARAALEARLSAEGPAFEAWLAEDRRGAAKGPKPDPLAMIVAKAGAEKALRERIDTLAGALAKAKDREGELEQAKAEADRLSRELADAKAAEAAAKAQLEQKNNALSDALERAKRREVQLDQAKAEADRLSRELADAKAAEAADKALLEQKDNAHSDALERAKAREVQLDRATAEVDRLSRELADAKAAEAADKALLQQKNDLLSDALERAKAQEVDLDRAKAEAERLTRALAGARTTASAQGARAWALLATVAILSVALVGLLVRDAGAPASQAVAQLQTDLGAAKRAAADAEANAAKLRDDLSASQTQALAGEAAGAKKLDDANAALAEVKDRVPKLQSELAASHKQVADVGPTKSTSCAPLAPLASRTAGVLSAAEECGLKPKDSFRECADCPTMVVVPAGSFMMGSPDNEPGRYPDESPRHEVFIAKPLAVAVFTATFGEWDACVRDGGCGGYVPGDNFWGRGSGPVINVSWDDARAYVAWLSKKTGKSYRLLNESEWEYSARAGTTTPFWQGATISPSQANYDGRQSYNGGPTGEFRKQTVPVGSFPPNGFGLYDMNGNVWQWVSDCYRTAYRDADGTKAPTDGAEWKAIGACGSRMVRGGSWINSPVLLRAAVRGWYAPEDRLNIVGFRVARTFTP